jgi:3-isopropylmalate dehydrogenase
LPKLGNEKVSEDRKFRVAVMGGDGTGPEVAAEGVKVLKAVAELEGIDYELQDFDYGGDRYLATGEILPEGATDELAKFDAILLGAIGHPDVAPGILERGLLLNLRFQFDQYINLRPVKLFPGVETPLAGKGPEDIDFVVVRENTEDLYAGIGGYLKKGHARRGRHADRHLHPQGLRALHPLGVRVHKKRNNPKGKRLTLVAKTNVLTYGHDLWMRTFEESAQSIPTSKRTTTTSTPAACGW